jgi:hypothetical protein
MLYATYRNPEKQVEPFGQPMPKALILPRLGLGNDIGPHMSLSVDKSCGN